MTDYSRKRVGLASDTFVCKPLEKPSASKNAAQITFEADQSAKIQLTEPRVERYNRAGVSDAPGSQRRSGHVCV